MEPAYVGLGGNLGEIRATMRAAIAELGRLPGVGAVRTSSLWLTEPVGVVKTQPWFLNAVAALELADDAAAPSPPALLAALLEIEARHGRDRSREVPAGPRAIDLDLLAWGARVIDEPGPPALVLPHPRLHARAFALAPLVELAGPDFLVAGPGGGRLGELVAAALCDPTQKLRRVSETI